MMFLEKILQNLKKEPHQPWIHEIHGKKTVTCTKEEFLKLVRKAKQQLQWIGVKKGERVVLLGTNSTQWIACDLAIISLGAITVPLYSRQDPKELAFMSQDSQPSLFIYSDEELKNEVFKFWDEPCESISLNDIFAVKSETDERPVSFHLSDPVTMVYTSGTSGHPKGAILNVGNINFMLERTTQQLYLAKQNENNKDRVFHFLPLCFAGSRLMLWTQLYRGNAVYLSTDLKNLVEEMGTAAPEFYLNVPAVLEKIRTGVEQKIAEKGGPIQKLYQKLVQAYSNPTSPLDGLLFLFLAPVILGAIRRKIGKNLKFLICGSAALSKDTQVWFEMLGIKVLQVYGLTETTGIVTMDHPYDIQSGWVGKPIDGVQVKIAKDGELLCKGPNVFPGYWNRPKETADCFEKGWFKTGDLAEISATGHIKITGRSKNLIIPASGHNIVPETIEELFQRHCPKIEHAVIVGHGKPYLSVIVTGSVSKPEIQRAIEQINKDVPHYRKIQTYYHHKNGFTIENGFLTANQKIKRRHIEQMLSNEIESMYGKSL